MRHRKQGRALSRNASHRRAMLANLAMAVLERERVQTTTAKAKEARRLVERLITSAKRNDLHARRQVSRIIPSPVVVSRLFSAIAPRYADRPGGYTRIIHVGHRQGDAAALSILELVERDGVTAAEADTEKKPAEPRTMKSEKQSAAKPETVEVKDAEAPTVEDATPEAVGDASVEDEETDNKKK